ncbi:protein translocase subunit SecF [Candidatus Curculioniphilus buchneri]|uniref:protein translocase subunit SecF n=1 Tax=Candidatus Curculioniphilus buchneri TaxID=690594 RepID=UPI00376EE16C
MRWANVAFGLSGVLLVTSIIIMNMRGFQLGIDFTGGTIVEVNFEKSVDLDQIRNALAHVSIIDPLIQHYGSHHNLMIHIPPVKTKFNQEISDQILSIIRQVTNQKAIIKRIASIGPSVSTESAQFGSIAILVALICILIYVTLRFEWRLATGTVISLAHDIVIILGVLSLFHIEIDMTIIASLISAIGYSLNDSIVVSDRIRENFRNIISQHLNTYEIFNLSLTQILNRTIITSVTTLIVVLILYIFGGSMLHNFSMTLLIGIFFGTISSIYVASALALKLGLKREHLLLQTIEKEGGDIFP